MVNCNLQLSMDNGQLEIGKNRQLMILHNGVSELSGQSGGPRQFRVYWQTRVSGQTGVSEYIPGLFL